MCYIELLQHFVGPDYREALPAIPIVMMAEILMGIYFNLSFWYKLNGQTWWGAVMSAIGCVVLVVINIIFVPKIGYMACAWGGLVGYGVCVLLSYFIGQKKNPVPYPVGTILGYFALTLALFALMQYVHIDNMVLRLLFNTMVLAIFVAVILWREHELVKPIFAKMKKIIRR